MKASHNFLSLTRNPKLAEQTIGNTRFEPAPRSATSIDLAPDYPRKTERMGM